MKFPFAIYCSFALCMLLLENCSNPQAIQQGQQQKGELYQCMPCGSECDKTTYDKPGTCSKCGMQLVKTATVTFKTLDPSAICAFIKSHPEAVLLDVRTQEEFEGKANPNFGTLKNAINVPIQQLEDKLSSITYLKDKEVLVYCSHSRRSPRASYILTQHGFTNVTNMAGGMSVVKDTSCKK